MVKGLWKPLMYYICDMQDKLDTNQLCDDVLNRIYHSSGHQSNAMSVRLILKHLTDKNIIIAMTIIVSDGFADIIDGKDDYITIKLNHKGIAFYHTDSYVNRAKRFDVDRQLNDLSLQKGLQELEINYKNLSRINIYYWIAIAGGAVSIISILASVVAWLKICKVI